MMVWRLTGQFLTRPIIFGVAWLSLCAGSAVLASQSASEVVTKSVPEAHLAGQARYTYLFWDVYDARLYAPQGQWQADQPFALALTYLRGFDGEDIAERSVKEMKAQGLQDQSLLKQWRQQMTLLFPDVVEQDTITGVRTASGATHFYLNDKLLGQVDDPAFGEWFFNIWLGPNTSEPAFREKLLALKGD